MPNPRKRARGSRPERRRLFLRGDEHSRGSVHDLARVGCCDLALRDEGRLQRGHLLDGRLATYRLVDREARADERRTRVRRRHVELDRDDLLLEPALVDRARRAHVRLVRVPVEILAREIPFRRDLLGRDPLHDDVEALVHRVRHRAAVRTHRNARHHLDAAGDDEVELARPHGGRRVEVRLHRRAALPVDGRPADRHRPAGGERDVAPDVPGLLLDLRDAAPLEVFDLARVDPVPLDETVHNLGRDVVPADVRERAVLLPDRAPNGVDDQCVCLSAGHPITVSTPC